METVIRAILPWTAVLGSNEGKKEKEGQEGGASGSPLLNLFVGIVAIVLGIYAGFLCWTHNDKEDMGVRVIYTGLAFANAIPYLIYYFFIRYVFNQPFKCCS